MTAVPRGGRIVISGASGFVGTHAVRILAAAGYEVVPVSADECDLTKGWPPLDRVDGVLHLAGLAAVAPSFDDPQRYLEVNSSMVTHLGEALLRRTGATSGGRSPRVVVVSSGALYGPSTTPLSEDSPLYLSSPYAVSKALVESQCHYYRNRGLDVIIARPFNHIGPGQGPGFIVPDLVAKLRALKPGEDLIAGNLESSRDYTDVRDVVRAYQLLLELAGPGHIVFNVASGVSRTGRALLEVMCEELGIAVPAVDMSIRRMLDPDSVSADASRLVAATGWRPTIPFRDSISDFVATGAA
jgi:GDP-4-dehydro-6-deoxy-D-mannose reductase